MNTHTQFSLPILLAEQHGIVRSNEPVSVGLPFPKGTVHTSAALRLTDPQGRWLPHQVEALSHWSDGSIRWALLDFQATVEAHTVATYQLRHDPIAASQPLSPAEQAISLQHSQGSLVVDTGAGMFFLNTEQCKPFDHVVLEGKDLLALGGSDVILRDQAGQTYVPLVQAVTVEAEGPVRATVKFAGGFRTADKNVFESPQSEAVDRDIPPAFAQFVARLHFYANSSLVGLEFTVHNPRAARHPGGLWDLGDAGSIYFSDLSLQLPLNAEQGLEAAWTTTPNRGWTRQASRQLQIYQDSSGGENWQSSNHVNRFGHVMHAFRGYRVTAGVDAQPVQAGNRASPVLALHNGTKSMVVAIDHFWQNFPKALEIDHNNLIVRLFPGQYQDAFELQGGEQKTHLVYVQFVDANKAPADLDWVHTRLVPRTSPEWYATAQTGSPIQPRCQNSTPDCVRLIDTAVNGEQSFFARREIIDEYGWRHFGELYADHEAVGHMGPGHTGQGENGSAEPLVSHYNNQYDAVYGAILQYWSSGDQRWFQLCADLARHVIDIDLYHTQEDRPAYNGGLFWHTDHYRAAATASHRTYSKASLAQANGHAHEYGGGPANEHNYTSGLLYYHFLTGSPAAREAVLSLANWVLNMDDGSHGLFGFFDSRPTGRSSATVGPDYHGPGRGAANSINALLDAYVLTRSAHYLKAAEQLIQRCIHPQDDIAKRGLDDVEHRWSYTVFLQVLGKYLDLKVDEEQRDTQYRYAQASLLHYAEWMLAHEVPYAQVLDRVEIPTETWPAQDIRKSNVLYLAAKHASEPLRTRLRHKADFFFQACLTDLQTFPTCTLTRPLVLLMANAPLSAYYQQHPNVTAPRSESPDDFGHPQAFTPQLAGLSWLRKKLSSGLHAIHMRKRDQQAVLQKDADLSTNLPGLPSANGAQGAQNG